MREAQATLARACAVVGLDARGATLLKFGENATYLLSNGTIVARISAGLDLAPQAARELRVTEWLRRHGVPAARPAEAAGQPIVVGDSLVTFWEAVRASLQPPTPEQLAGALLRLHAVPVPDGLASIDPLWIVERRVRSEGSTAEREVILRRCDQLREAYDRLEFSGSPRVVHGDAHVHNLLRDDAGTVVLMDLEHSGTGPREWDLVPTATHDVLGWRPRGEYRAFAEAYGVDVTTSPTFGVMNAMRELLMLSFLMRRARSDTRVAAEVRRRVVTIRDDIVPRGWVAF
ncbi:MAG: phosphotransferase enzyme family protein [Candidatus Limnocylindria bacterium]